MNALPHLHQNSQTLSLSLDTTLIQSVMRRDAPNELVLDYTRTMMGALLLQSEPRHILMIGLGGGSLPKYCRAHMASSDITVVEISPEVIALREEFLIPPDGDHFRILCDDGAEFIKRPPRRYDWIMVDGYDGQGLPAALSTRSFYERCQAALTDHGVLILNLQADTSQCRQLTQRLMRLFNNQVLAIESDEGGNEIILASSAKTMCEGLQQFDARWQALPDVHQATLAVCSTRVQRALRKCPPDGLNQTSELSPL